MIAACLAILMLVAHHDADTSIAVTVLAPQDISDSLVFRICAEADAIWGPAGLVFECERHRLKAEPCQQRIEVTVDDRRSPVGVEDALGWLTFRDGAPDCSIHLSRSSAERLLHSTPGVSDGTISLHESLIGRALGRALAHEFGHYVFQSQTHTVHGLMRRAWDSEQVFAVARTPFELTDQQRALAEGHSTRCPD